MATITGLTADRMLEIEAASVVDGDISGDNLILTKHDGSIINAGSVRGPAGPVGPMGQSLAVVTAQPVLDVGIINQIRAGRQLTLADFTNQGLNPPLGLWNLSGNGNDSSGNGRNLTNKGSVPFGVGINGLASTAGAFAGSTGQVLYLPDTGAADPLRMKQGSWGCWMRTGRGGIFQRLLSKFGAPGNYGWTISVGSSNQAYVDISTDGTALVQCVGQMLINDDRWHFLAVTMDGTKIRLYVDGVCETSVLYSGNMFATNGPLNIGGRSADGSIATTEPVFGRIDECFVTTDILSEDQVRYLYCASIAHALGSIPVVTSLAVQRRKRGAALATTDFPAQPLRLHNFVNGALTDEGSNNVPLVNNTPAVLTPGNGPDGLSANGFTAPGTHSGMQASDAGLPSAKLPRSAGVWVKSNNSAGQNLVCWGTYTTADFRIGIGSPAGQVFYSSAGDTISGPRVDDGLWHHIVGVDDDSAADGLRRKLYLDGRLVGTSTVLNSVTLSGATGFRVANSAGGGPLIGQIGRVWVYNGALTPEQVKAIYLKGSQALASSPKAPGDHIEAVEAGRILADFSALEPGDTISLAVMT